MGPERPGISCGERKLAKCHIQDGSVVQKEKHEMPPKTTSSLDSCICEFRYNSAFAGHERH